MPQGTFTISMERSARYVTQGAAYERLLVGAVLTDRRIAQLKKKGYYKDSGPVLPPVAGRKKRRTMKSVTVEELLARYNI